MRLHRTAFAIVAGLLVAALALATGPAIAAPPKAGPPVYVLRGGMDIFSTGMDTIAEELNAKGIPATSLNFANWRPVFDEIVQAYKKRRYPIALVGHSWGANTIILMSYELAKLNIPVALLALYDATDTARVPPNVRWVINFRSSASIGLNVTVTGTGRFGGRIDTINVPDADHVQIDKRDDLHKQTINAIMKVLGRRG